MKLTMTKELQKMQNTDIQDRENELRRILDGGKCVLVGDRWFGSESSLEERERYLAALNRRKDRNRRRRERRMALATFEAFERSLAGRPAWAQSRLTGRTAVVETVNGQKRQVSYQKTYGLRNDPFAYPFPGGRTPLELIVDGAITTWGFVCRGRRLLAQRQRNVEAGTRCSRLRNERRKLCARSTLATHPTATDIRVAWAFARESHANMLHLGGMLHDLECFLQNELQVMWIKRRPKIVGRSAGIRGWIRENCPELIGKYKTLMRYKALARRLRQASEIVDPVPTSAILANVVSAKDLLSHTATVQSHAGGGRVERFAWEHGEPRVDADGRTFLTNDNYRNSSRTVALSLSAMKGQSFAESDQTGPDAVQRLGALLESARRTVREVLTTAGEADIASHTRHNHRKMTMLTLWEQIGKILSIREKWWDGVPRPLRSVTELKHNSQWSTRA